MAVDETLIVCKLFSPLAADQVLTFGFQPRFLSGGSSSAAIFQRTSFKLVVVEFMAQKIARVPLGNKFSLLCTHCTLGNCEKVGRMGKFGPTGM